MSTEVTVEDVFSLLVINSWIGLGRGFGDIRVYIDGDCDYLMAGGAAWFSPAFLYHLGMLYVILHVYQGCTGTMYIVDAKENILFATISGTIPRGIYIVTLETFGWRLR